MTTKQRTVLLAVPFFAAFAFIPFMNPGGKVGLIRVWMAYPAFVGSLLAGQFDELCLACFIIVIAHLGVAIALGALLSRALAAWRGGRRLQPGAAPNAAPAERFGNSRVVGGPPSVS